jgi:hypothetical protein
MIHTTFHITDIIFFLVIAGACLFAVYMGIFRG